MDTTIDSLKKLLQERDLRATPIRLEFLELLRLNTPSAVTLSVIQEACHNTDRVTLYRTIQTFLDKGIIHKAHQSKEEVYYALCNSNCSTKAHFHDHLHFKCSSCSQVTCQHLNKEIKFLLPSFQINKVEIHIEGVCNRCNTTT